MKYISIAGVKVKKDNLPTREQLIKAALFTGKMTEEAIIKEVDSHELYGVLPKGLTEDSEQGEYSKESERTDTAKRTRNNKAGNK